jgi:hypothetical protein
MSEPLFQAMRSGDRRWQSPPWAPRVGLFAVALLAATVLRADCPAEATRVVALDLSACRPASVAIEEQVAGSAVWWLWDYMASIAWQAPGVVVRGSVARWRRFVPPQTLGPWQPGGSDEEYFFPSLDEEFCSTFEPLDSILLVIDVPCCDIIPPVDVACLLELPQARSPTPLERELAERQPEEDQP